MSWTEYVLFIIDWYLKSRLQMSMYIPLCMWIFYFIIFYLIHFIDYAITVVPFPPLHSTPPCIPPPTHIPPYSSCPWVIHICSLASTFPILFLTSPVYFLPTIYATYSLSLSPLSHPPTPLLIILHVIFISLVLFLF